MLGLCHWVVKIRALRDRWPFWAACFGRFAGLPSEDLHGVIYLTVLGFAAAGIAAMRFFCEESNAGKAFRAIRKDPLLAQSQGINVSASKLCGNDPASTQAS